MGIHFEKVLDLWVCLWEISGFIGMLLRNSQIVYLIYLNNAITFLLFVKSHQKVTIPPQLPDLWVYFAWAFRIYGYKFLQISGFMGVLFWNFPDLWGVVLETEWHNPVRPSTKLPPGSSSIRWITIAGYNFFHNWRYLKLLGFNLPLIAHQQGAQAEMSLVAVELMWHFVAE